MASTHLSPKPAYCIVAASPLTVRAFLLEHIRELAKTGRVEILSDFGDTEPDLQLPANVFCRRVKIPRRISLLADFFALCQLWRLFRSIRPSMVFSITAKTGLLAMCAAFLAGVRIRLHCFTGQAWADKQGVGRWILKNADKVTAKLATHLLADSPSQREFLESEIIVPKGRVHVPGSGSISGVDCARFKPDTSKHHEMRQQFQMQEDSLLILFLARVKRSKGVLELLQAFEALATENSKLHLAIIGPDEENLDPLIHGSATRFSGRIHRVSEFVGQHQEFLQASDIFCLPSHYEGFGTVVIEAGACGVPTVAANIYGLSDAVQDEVTGLLHRPGDVDDLARQLSRLINNDALRLRLGAQARNRAREAFDTHRVIAGYMDYIRSIFTVCTKG